MPIVDKIPNGDKRPIIHKIPNEDLIDKIQNVD